MNMGTALHFLLMPRFSEGVIYRICTNLEKEKKIIIYETPMQDNIFVSNDFFILACLVVQNKQEIKFSILKTKQKWKYMHIKSFFVQCSSGSFLFDAEIVQNMRKL